MLKNKQYYLDLVNKREEWWTKSNFYRSGDFDISVSRYNNFVSLLISGATCSNAGWKYHKVYDLENDRLYTLPLNVFKGNYADLPIYLSEHTDEEIKTFLEDFEYARI